MKASDTQDRRPYKDGELATIFRTAIYGPEPLIPQGDNLWAAWCLPVLSLFTGARLEELGQALVSDIRCKHGID